MAKKRANGEGTIRQRKDGTWEARMTVDGKVKCFYGKTQRTAMDARKAYKKALEAGLNVEAGKMTVAQWLDIWFRDYTPGIKDSTAVRYEVDMRLHVKPYIGTTKLAALKAPAIQRLYNQKLNDGMSPKSVRNIHGMLHKALDQAVKLDYINKNISDLCILPKSKKEEIHPLKDEEIPAFLSIIRGHEYEVLYRVALFTGMRQGELLGLQWDSIDFNRGTIFVHQQLQRMRKKGSSGGYKLVPTKNSKVRTIVPAKQVLQLLRHTYAALSLQNGDDIKTLSTNLEHATTAFTMDVYGHVSQKMREASAARMENYISNL